MPLTVLEIGKEVALKIGISQPSAVFGSTNREDVELLRAIKDAALDLAQLHEWQLLRKIATITGDGSTLTHSLPSDFLHVLADVQMYTSEFQTALTFVENPDDWLRYDVQSYDFVVNVWTVYQDLVHTKPALGSSVTGKYWYMSDLLWLDTDGTTTKNAIAADDDTFRLDDDALILGAAYKYRQNKGQPYAEEMADYEKRKAVLIGKEPKKVYRSKPRIGRGVQLSYPEAVSDA